MLAPNPSIYARANGIGPRGGVVYPSACTGAAGTVLLQFRATDLGGTVGIFIEPPCT